MEDKNKSYYSSTMASKIFRIINCFSLNESELTVAELSERLDIARSSLYRLLLLLEQEEILEKNPDTGCYSLSVHMLDLSAIVLSRMEIRRHGQYELEQLMRKVNLDANLSILYKADSMSIAFALCSENTGRFYTVIGRRTPAHITAMGKTMLAALPREKVHKLINQYGWRPYTNRSIGNFETLDRELDKVAKDGFAIDDGEGNLFTACVAAPVHQKNGQIAGAISVSGDRDAVFSKLDFNRNAVMDYAARLSRRLGYTGSYVG